MCPLSLLMEEYQEEAGKTGILEPEGGFSLYLKIFTKSPLSSLPSPGSSRLNAGPNSFHPFFLTQFPGPWPLAPVFLLQFFFKEVLFSENFIAVF